jgi:very-short-patch-repair endonuclease
MGWADVKVAVEYDGEHHRLDAMAYRKDLIRLEYIQSLGWIVIRVVAKHRRPDIVQRVAEARASRLP